MCQSSMVPSFQVKMEFSQQRSRQSLETFMMPVFQDHPFIAVIGRFTSSMWPTFWSITKVNNMEVTFLSPLPIGGIKLMIPREPTICKVSDYFRSEQWSHLLTRDPVTLRRPVHQGDSSDDAPLLGIPHSQGEVFSLQPVVQIRVSYRRWVPR